MSKLSDSTLWHLSNIKYSLAEGRQFSASTALMRLIENATVEEANLIIFEAKCFVKFLFYDVERFRLPSEVKKRRSNCKKFTEYVVREVGVLNGRRQPENQIDLLPLKELLHLF